MDHDAIPRVARPHPLSLGSRSTQQSQGAVLMSASTVVVALNAQLLRRLHP